MIRPMIAERGHFRDGEQPEGTRRRARSVRVNLAESPLGWLKAHGRLSDRQFVAGEKLRADYERALLSPHVTMHWSAAPIGSGQRNPEGMVAETHAQLSAKRRFEEAIDHAGPGLSDILWRVVCACEAMPQAERALGWPSRAGKLVLELALNRIADYYHVK